MLSLVTIMNTIYRAFGSQGSSDGRFNYPWGVTTDCLGFIFVCDKENNRICGKLK